MKNKATSPRSRSDWERVDRTNDGEIDLSDLPEIRPEAFTKALIRRDLKPVIRKAQGASTVPRSETVLRIFLASPSDLGPERDIVSDVVMSLDRASTKTEGRRLEVVRWEKDVIPGAGSDAQDVVNRQIGDDSIVAAGFDPP